LLRRYESDRDSVGVSLAAVLCDHEPKVLDYFGGVDRRNVLLIGCRGISPFLEYEQPEMSRFALRFFDSDIP
jgi:hypothetical protein